MTDDRNVWCPHCSSVRVEGPKCDHDYQWHPESDDFGVCARCGADAPVDGPPEHPEAPVIPDRDEKL